LNCSKVQNEVENQLGKNIKLLQSDRGGENISLKFVSHLKECGILSQLTLPRTPHGWLREETSNLIIHEPINDELC
jgi:hypothetical protein